MKNIRTKGKTVEEAVLAGAQILGVERANVEYRIINEGKSGVLGVFGGEEAEVEVREKMPKAELAKEMLQEVLNRMGAMAISEIQEETEGDIILNIKGEDLGRIIGKDGETLKALQNIVTAMMSHEFAEKVRVYLDAGGYRERHNKALERLALECVKDVEETGGEKVLPPMSAADRRVIHVFLKENDKVKTFSRGEGAERRLIIAPK